MGKTTFAVSVTLGAARAGFRVTLATPAMSPVAVRLRLAGAMAGVDRGWGCLGFLGQEKKELLDQCRTELDQLPIRLIGDPLLDLAELHRAVRPAGSCDLLVIDDLHSMPEVQESKSAFFSGPMERGPTLRWLARWLRIPVLVTIDLPLPKRADPFPVLRDFPRDMVRAAELTMALHREAYYADTDYSAPRRIREEESRRTQGAVLWDSGGTRRAFQMELCHKEGPVFR